MITILKGNENQILSEDKLQFAMRWDMIQLEKIKDKLIMIEKDNQLHSKESKYTGKSWVLPASKRSH